jgi:hypothetical protein
MDGLKNLMIKKIIPLLLILVVFLVACQSAPPSPIEASSTEADLDQIGGDAPSTELPPLPEVSPTPEQAGNAGEANCTVVSSQPTPGPTEQSLVPSVGEADWAHGPEDAKVTIIEYGDFQ